MPLKERTGLTGNALKIIAMIAMTCDHVGLQLLPQYPFLRILGRLALPIYAWMIAEGCRHTRDRKKYLLRLASLAFLCQIVYFFAMNSLYMCILVTFSLSVCTIWIWEKKPGVPFCLTLLTIFVLCTVLPDLLPGTDYQIDYGIWGVLLPWMIYTHGIKGLSVGLLLLALSYGGYQWFAFGALPLLMLYNGQRGKTNLGKLFYYYYPAHLVIIYFLGLLISSS